MQKALAITQCIMHNGGMRNHREIARAIGTVPLVDLTGAPILTVRSWIARGSIPTKHWPVLIAAGHSTAEELMNAKVDKAA